MTKITIQVIAETGFVSTIDLAQELEGYWPTYIQDMKNAGHKDETIVRVIGERIKSMAQPYLAIKEPKMLKVVNPPKKPRKPRAPREKKRRQ